MFLRTFTFGFLKYNKIFFKYRYLTHTVHIVYSFEYLGMYNLLVFMFTKFISVKKTGVGCLPACVCVHLNV